MDFDKLTTRLGTSCVKWDEMPADDILPLWVADMDFETAPCIADAIQRRAAHPIYGYALVPDGFYDAIRWWNRTRHNWDFPREWIQYTSGVVPAVSAILQGLCREGDAVLTFTPAYNCFFSSIRNAHCPLVDFPLTWDPEAETSTIDFQAFEEAIRTRDVRLFLLCNPHNPTGRVWTSQELRKMAEICKRADVIVLSDEIHCEFVDPQLGRPYIPFATIAEEVGCRWVVANAPNKAFNSAGLQTAYIVCPDATMRRRIDRAINDNETCDINIFAPVALQAAYTPEGAAWLDQLVAYIYDNYRTFRQQLKAALPLLPLARLEGTYLAWLDVRSLLHPTPHPSTLNPSPLTLNQNSPSTLNPSPSTLHQNSPSSLSTSQALATYLTTQHRVWVNPGEMYGRPGFLRINIATQRSRLNEATRRIIAGLKACSAHI